MILEEYTWLMEIIDSITSLLLTVRFHTSLYHIRTVLMVGCILRLNPMAQYTLHIGTTATCITELAIFLNQDRDRGTQKSMFTQQQIVNLVI